MVNNIDCRSACDVTRLNVMQKALGDIFDYRPVTRYIMSVVNEDSLNKGYMFLYLLGNIIRIFHGCMVWIEKSVTRVTDRPSDAEQ